MRKILLFLVFFCIFNKIYSQATPFVTINAPAPVCNAGECVDLMANFLPTETTTNYSVQTIPYLPPASFAPLSDSFVFDSSQDDRWSSTFSLPFDFCFYGQFYNQVLVGSNGVVTFDINGVVPMGNQNPGGFCQWSFNQIIPNTTFPIRNSIYGVYQDTNINTPPVINPAVQNVNYRVYGTSPNRLFVVSYNDLPQFSCNDGVGRQTSQIVLYETSNIIEVYVARRTPCTTWNGGRGLIGIQNQDGMQALVAPGRNTGTWTAMNEAWRFVPDGNVVTSQISWLANGVPIAGSTGQNPFNVCPTLDTDYTALIRYTQCDATIRQISATVTVGPVPYPLEFEPEDVTICTSTAPPYTFNIDQTAYMLGSLNPSDFGITYHTSLLDAQNGFPSIPPASLSNYTANGGETIWVRAEDFFVTGCPVIETFQLVAVPNPSGTISYSSTNYCSNDATLQSPTNTAPAGGQYIVTPATGLSINPTTGVINPDLSIEGMYSIVYSLATSATCPAYDTPPVSIDIINCDCSLVLTSAVNTDNQTLCISDAITPIEYSAGGIATGINVTGLPVGISGSFSGGVLTITGTSATTGTFNYSVTTTGCVSNLILTGTIIVGPLPTVTSLTSNSPICENQDAIFTVVGTPNATVSYTINAGAVQTVVLDGTGNGVVTITSATIDQTILLNDITIGTCVTPLTNTETVIVNPLPTVTSLTSNSPVCENQDAIFTVVGTPNATVSYTINAGAVQTVVLDAAGSAIVTIASATADQTILLTQIDNTATTCINPLTNTETVTVTPLPVVSSLTSNSPVCENQDAIFTIIGTSNATVSYTINAGTVQTVVLDATGNGVVTITSATVDQTILLNDITIGTCVTPLTNTETVTVNPLPTVTSLTSNTPICENQNAIFTVVGTPNTTISYIINAGAVQTVVLDATGNGTVTIASATTDQTILLTEIANTITTCTNPLTNTETITVIAIPNAGMLSGTQNICEASSTTFSSTSTGGTWSSSDLTIAIVNATTGVVTGVSSGIATITYTIAGTGGCSGDTATRDVTVSVAPNAGILSGMQDICEGNSTTFTSTSTGGTWSSSNQAIATVDATGVVTGISAGTATITYTVAGTGGCTNATSTRDITVIAIPVPVLFDGTICVELATNTVFQSYILDSGFSDTQYTFNWYFNGTIIAGANQSTYEALATGNYYVEVTAIGLGCQGSSNTVSVSVINNATDYTYTLTNAFSDNATIVVTVIDGMVVTFIN
ncbi:MAG: hypothetical protein HC854_01425 [Flavobacterium sp.]|nr:hypothetical protein [Flavobacterium sp.]